jgi:glutathione S-transferase
MARGYVRDLRVRWALEEAALPYRVRSAPFNDRTAEHFAHQPFGQVPWLTDGELSIFESGAILLYLGKRSDALMPTEPRARNEAAEWLFAALNSVEMASLPWTIAKFMGDDSTAMRQRLDGFLESRLQHMDAVLAEREWLAGLHRGGCLLEGRLAPLGGDDHFLELGAGGEGHTHRQDYTQQR